jgi:hypothetical protein
LVVLSLIVISGNAVRDNTTNAVLVWHYQVPHFATNIDILGNTFENCAISGSAISLQNIANGHILGNVIDTAGNGIFIVDHTDLTIQNNLIKSISQRGIYGYNSADCTQQNKLTISKNIVRDSVYAAIFISPAVGLTETDAVIEGNVLIGNNTSAVDGATMVLRRITNLYLYNNSIIANGGSTKYLIDVSCINVGSVQNI